MDISKNALLGALGALILIIGIAAFNLPTPVVNVAPVVEKIVEKPLGAIPGTEITGPNFTVGNVEVIQDGRAMTTGTTTPYAFRPAATSTLAFAECLYDAASTTLSLWTFAKATTPYATTTRLGEQKSVAGGTKATFTATTSPATTLNNDLVFTPNQYFVVGVQGGTAGSTFSLTAADRCKVGFRKL